MNNKIFKSATNIKPTNAVNAAGGKAYKLEDKEALAQLVVTGCFNNTFYSNGKDMLAEVIKLAKQCDPDFVAKLAVYGRKNAFMKDSPAVLLAILSSQNPILFRQVAGTVLNNMKMVRNFVQTIRSGTTGRKSLGSGPKKAIQRYFDKQSDEQLFMQSVGQSPSVVDIIKLAHIKAKTPARDNLFKYLMGIAYNAEMLPQLVKDYEAFKLDTTRTLPAVDWQMLSNFSLSDAQWVEIGRNMNWHALRMNLNTLQRHNTLADKSLVKNIVAKLTDKTTIEKINVFPYQLFATYLNTNNTAGMPSSITSAVQDALDISVQNVPKLENITHLFVCIDTSGSMSSPVTGIRGTVSTAVRCSDAAAIFAASFAKTNQSCNVNIIDFNTNAKELKINLRDSLVTIASSMNTPGGGTNCSSAVEYIKQNYKLTKQDKIAVIMISDNCSWAEYYNANSFYSNGTGLATVWKSLRKVVSESKLVLIDIQPYTTTQLQTSSEVLNVGGFSDAVFDVVTKFINNSTSWAQVIDAVKIPWPTLSSPTQVTESEE